MSDQAWKDEAAATIERLKLLNSNSLSLKEAECEGLRDRIEQLKKELEELEQENAGLKLRIGNSPPPAREEP